MPETARAGDANPGNPLAGRVVAVTGASRGIGLGIVGLLAQSGAMVIAGARSAHASDSGLIRHVPLDVRAEASVAEFARIAISLGVDTLVNNAGVGSFAALEDASVEEFQRIFETNVLGTLLACRALIPHFKRRHLAGLASQVINVTSDVSARTFAGGGIYTASKHAQRALTHTLAHEGQGYGLRVTEIRPGMTDTYFNQREPGSPERAAHLKAADVAQAVLHAVSAPPHVRIDEILLHPVIQHVAY